MGSTNTREQQIPQQFTHLSSNPRNQQLLNQIYQQNSLDVNPYYHNQGYHGPRPGQIPGVNSQIQVQKTVPIKAEMIINKNSLRLDKINEKKYLFTFEYTFDVLTDLTIYFGGVDHIDDKSNTTQRIENKNGDKLGQNTFRVFPGKAQKWDGLQYPLDLSKVSLNSVLKYDGTFQFPIIIKCEKVDKTQENKIFYTYCTIQPNRNSGLGVMIIKTKLELNKFGYWTEEVYGIAESGLNQNTEKDCSICLSEKIDTIILPCRHMCLCYDCCTDLKKKANKCPICRQSMTSFLKLVQYREQQNQYTQQIPSGQAMEQQYIGQKNQYQALQQQSN